jgi:integrase
VTRPAVDAARRAVEAGAGGQRPPGLLGRLLAAVRPEFRVEVLVPGPDDVILGAPVCVVPGCGRVRRERNGLCRGHLQRWRRQGRPELAGFVEATPAPTLGRGRLLACAVPGCNGGRHGQGLCRRHHGAWQQAGRPELAVWAATVTVDPTAVRPVCGLPSCSLWATNEQGGFCRSHQSRWRRWQQRTDQHDVEAFIRDCETRGEERLDFRPLPAQLRLELQYAVQCRVDQRRGRAKPSDLAVVVRVAACSGAGSLLDWPQAVWDATFAELTPRAVANANAIPLGFLRFARRCVDDLAHGQGWDAEYPRDVWDLRRVGIVHPQARRIRFDRIPQPWLRDLVKRWVRWKLTTDVSPVHVARSTTFLVRFARFLATPTVRVDALAGLTREVLERYAAEATYQLDSVRSRRLALGSVNRFLQAIRQHRWDASLPGEAVYYREDFPKPPPLKARGLPEPVMAQLEQPDNLARLADPAVRLLTLILLRTGLRIGDGARLGFDCVVRDAQDAPYLRYWNHKLHREAAVPIDADLADQIGAQQQRVLARWPQPTVLLPRQTANPDGRWPLPQATYRAQLGRWLAACDIRDEHGRLVHITPHQWRHTFATRLLNLDVPQEVVRKLLDHDSHQMTGHYARLHDQTVRRHWEQARKVNIAGETVTLDPGGPLAEAAWAKDRLARAKQALPNGYCGLPLQQTCPHANACLTCPVFITTPQFLPQHHQQRARTLQLIATAQAGGQTRMVEMNRQVLGNLDRIITALEAGADPDLVEGTADAG